MNKRVHKQKGYSSDIAEYVLSQYQCYLIIGTLHDLRERVNALEKETAYIKGAIYMLLALLPILIAALLRAFFGRHLRSFFGHV